MGKSKNKAGLSQSAAEKVFSLMAEESNLDLMLRVYIQGGGCSGFQYGFSFEEEASYDDNIISNIVVSISASDYNADFDLLAEAYNSMFLILDSATTSFPLICVPFLSAVCDRILQDVLVSYNEVKLLIDAISYQYLQGATIDYKVGVDGEYFTVNNPNAKTTCGCGSSFSVA